jgi:hypothetical protein
VQFISSGLSAIELELELVHRVSFLVALTAFQFEKTIEGEFKPL